MRHTRTAARAGSLEGSILLETLTVRSLPGACQVSTGAGGGVWSANGVATIVPRGELTRRAALRSRFIGCDPTGFQRRSHHPHEGCDSPTWENELVNSRASGRIAAYFLL